MIMVIINSFGYAIILPSLRSYFKSDVRMLRRAILIGSAIPHYILWIAVAWLTPCITYYPCSHPTMQRLI